MARKTTEILTAADLFAGAGGLSLGFENAGFKMKFAVECDSASAETYAKNRPKNGVKVIKADVAEVDFPNVLKEVDLRTGDLDVLLAGPPCQGFSTSNMKTRNSANPQNGLFKEFLRAVREIKPIWVLFENVPGILTFEKGAVVKSMTEELDKLGYSCSHMVLNAADFGVPQLRRRFFLMANRSKVDFSFPQPTHGDGKKQYVCVRDAIADLPVLENGNQIELLSYHNNGVRVSSYQKEMRKNWKETWSTNNLVSRNNDLVIRRYKKIPPGGNWRDIPDSLMQNYTNKAESHSGIYRRLEWENPSIVISNFRKNMLIHPEQDRGLSVREAARIQSFPDRYVFWGLLGAQQQQVADAVPPLLAKVLALSVKESLK